MTDVPADVEAVVDEAAVDKPLEFVQPVVESEIRESKPDENGVMVLDVVRQVIAVDEGENGTWRDAITIPGDEYQQHVEKGTLDEFVQAQADERYQAELDRRNAPPEPVVPPTEEERAQAVVDKRLQIVGLGEEYAGIAGRYVQLVRELIELDGDAQIPPLPVPTAMTPPELDALKEEARVRAQIAELDAQIAEAERVAEPHGVADATADELDAMVQEGLTDHEAP